MTMIDNSQVLSSNSETFYNKITQLSKDIYFAIKRKYYLLRYPNLTLNGKVKIKGKLSISDKLKVTIDTESRIGKTVKFFGYGKIIIGKNVSLNGCWIGCQKSVKIGDDCLISDCYLLDTDYHNLEPHLRHAPPRDKVAAPITIGKNVWIGANATVMKGVNIGENSVIGLGSVVRKSVPPNVVVIGNPQQIVKSLVDDPIKSNKDLLTDSNL